MGDARRTFWNSNFFLVTIAVIGLILATVGLVGILYLAERGTPSLLPWIIGGWGALLTYAAYEEWDQRPALTQDISADDWTLRGDRIDA